MFIFRFLARLFVTVWNLFFTLGILMVTPILVYGWVSGKFIDACASEDAKCWLFGVAFTGVVVAMFLLLIFFFVVRWSLELQRFPGLQFTREMMSSSDFTKLLSGIGLAGKIYRELRDIPGLRGHAWFARIIEIVAMGLVLLGVGLVFIGMAWDWVGAWVR